MSNNRQYAFPRKRGKIGKPVPVHASVEQKPDAMIESLAQKMADAECAPGEEELWRYLAESDRNAWRAAAKVAITELSNPEKESGNLVVFADGFCCDCVLQGAGGYLVHVAANQHIPDRTRVLFVSQ